MNKLAAVGVMAVVLILVVGVCGCVQQTSTPSNETGKVQQRISNVTERIGNVTEKIGNVTEKIGNVTSKL